MSHLILLIGSLSFLTGIILLLSALWYRVPDHPGITGKDTMKAAIFWRHKELWSPKGYRLHLWGMILFLFGLILNVIYYLFLAK